MGYYQTPICKWGKHPVCVMGVAEDYGQNQFQFQIQFQGQENFEDATIFSVQIEKA